MKKAGLLHQGTLYLATHPHAEGISTPVTKLLRGIWNQFPNAALRMVRERVFTNYPLSPQCEGMMKVAAKRSSLLSSDEFEAFLAQTSEKTVVIDSFVPPTFFSQALPPPPGRLDHPEVLDFLALLRNSAQGPKPVGALLLSSDSQVIHSAWSLSSENRTQHAELNLCQSYAHLGHQAFPKGSSLWVSLRPCAMCSAQILALAPRDGDFEVYFLEEDPGPAARNSCLRQGSALWKKAASPLIPVLKISDLN